MVRRVGRRPDAQGVDDGRPILFRLHDTAYGHGIPVFKPHATDDLPWSCRRPPALELQAAFCKGADFKLECTQYQGAATG